MITKEDIRKALEEVMDPEIPTISLVDLGIVTDIQVEGNTVKVALTPTFSGCPALKVMEELVEEKIKAMGLTPEVKTTFDVAWNTNMITDKGREALKKHGLAPPPKSANYVELDVLSDVECPRCGSRNTTMDTPFGPTLCRSIHYCKNCHEAFEQFKPVM